MRKKRGKRREEKKELKKKKIGKRVKEIVFFPRAEVGKKGDCCSQSGLWSNVWKRKNAKTVRTSIRREGHGENERVEQ